MECKAARAMLCRKIDGELSDPESIALDAHLAQCPSCLREYRILSIPNRIARVIPAPKSTPFFYQKLRTNIEGKEQNFAIWQMLWVLSRRIIPAFAGITLALISIFAYLQMRSPEAEIYRSYERVFITEEQPYQLLMVEQGNITDEKVLRAIAEGSGNP